MNDSLTSVSQPVVGKETASATDAVFQAILRDIITGVYSPGARLPAERELSKALGASRPTLREALRRLSEWCLVQPRRGSGIVVRSPREWSIEVLPAVLRHGRFEEGEPVATELIMDLLALRRSLMVEMLRMAVERVPPGGTAPARDAAWRAWEARHETEIFLLEDLAVLRNLVEAAKFLPALWLMNRLAGVYQEIARGFAAAVAPPDDYLAIYDQVFSAVEGQSAASAAALFDEYLQRQDRRIAAFLQAR